MSSAARESGDEDYHHQQHEARPMTTGSMAWCTRHRRLSSNNLINSKSNLSSPRQCVLMFAVFASVLWVSLGATITTTTANTAATSPKPDAGGNTCTSNECIQIAGKMWDSMNARADPCEDFYEYVCGRYSRSPLPQGVDSWGHFQENENKIRLNLIESLKNAKTFETKPAALVNLYSFFRGCLNTTLRDEVGYGQLYALLNDLGGWPMLEGRERWTRRHGRGGHGGDMLHTRFNWQDAFIRLARHNLFFLIKIEATNHLRDTNKTIIKIGPPYKTRENIINLGPLRGQRRYTLNKHYSFEGRRAEEVEVDDDDDNFDDSYPDDQLAVDATPKVVVGTTTTTTAPLSNDQKIRDKTRRFYYQLVKEIHRGLNRSEPLEEATLTDQADGIIDLQRALEENASPIKPMSYYQKHYEEHLYTTQQLRQLVDIDLIALVQRVFIANNGSTGQVQFHDHDVFFVPDIEYFKGLGRLLKNETKTLVDDIVLANYFSTNAVIGFGQHTTTRMIEMLLTRLDRPDVIENVCFEETASYMPELLGKLYVDSMFDVKFKNNISFVVQAVHDSFRELLLSSWMDEPTKAEALDKLDAMLINTGYPEWFEDEKTFEEYCSMFNSIRQDDYFTSVLMATVASFTIDMSVYCAKFNMHSNNISDSIIGTRKQIIDVNAFYYFNTNGIYIPAGILQYPFYNKDVPLSVLFGSLGMIVGHEMTHAFDDSGRLYDKNGALRNWWTNKTLEEFEEKTDCFVKQYSNMNIGDYKVDGTRTLAENIADTTSLHEAFQAFKMHEDEHNARQRLPGYMSRYSHEQLFFISFANMWCTIMDEKALHDQVTTNVHSPPPIRVFASLANSPHFATVFGCSNHTRMNPVDKCLIY